MADLSPPPRLREVGAVSRSPPGPGTLCLDMKCLGLSGRARLRYRSWGRQGGPGLLFHFLGSVFGTEGWHRPQRAADSHFRETDKESTFCQQNPAQLPQSRRGEEEPSRRKEREVHRLPPQERGEGGGLLRHPEPLQSHHGSGGEIPARSAGQRRGSKGKDSSFPKAPLSPALGPWPLHGSLCAVAPPSAINCSPS